MNHGNSVRHKLQFLVNDHVVPYNMTVYQAIRQFNMGNAGKLQTASLLLLLLFFFLLTSRDRFDSTVAILGMDQSETDTESETPMGHASIWVQTHTIYYRPVPENDPSNYSSPSSGKGTGAQNVLLPCGASSSSVAGAGTRKGKGATGKSSSKKKGDDLWTGMCIADS